MDGRWRSGLDCRRGCANVISRWDWVAGPIPQSNSAPESDKTDFISACVGDQSLLSRLPRPGAYAFQCTATCVCDQKQLSKHVLASFFVGEDANRGDPAESADVTGEKLEEAERISDPLGDERNQDESINAA
ncbi:hypothetical protein AHF37_01782 [Paragonimus kellicotti]|nr:hypothetical protein AHF37_01782 [Paragonimus kellicotti]